MSVVFYCSHCGKLLPAAGERLIGREIRCPFCHSTIKLVPAPENAKDDFELNDLLTEHDGESGNNESPATHTLTASMTAPSPAPRRSSSPSSAPSSLDSGDDFEIAPVVLMDAENQASHETLSDLIPCFKPNPFGFSFPLEKYHPPSGDDDEYDGYDPQRDDSYDVDDLIGDIEKPDGNF